MTVPKEPAREQLIRALYADLVGPFGGAESHESSTELLRTNPSEWYLTGFLVPESDREPPPDVFDDEGEGDDVPREDASEDGPRETKRPKLFPASMGMSVLLPAEAEHVVAEVSFARYVPEWVREEGAPGRGLKHWRRVPQPTQRIRISLRDEHALQAGLPLDDTPTVRIEGRLAEVGAGVPGVPAGARALSLFVVNRDAVVDGDELGRTGRMLFQVQLALESPVGFLHRPNRAGMVAPDDFDAQTADLQFREKYEWAVGHNVAAEPAVESGAVHRVRTRWIPRTEVALVDARKATDVEVAMEALAQLDSAAAVRRALAALPERYGEWLEGQAAIPLKDSQQRRTRDLLLGEAEEAGNRIAAGIDLLASDVEARRAFGLANEAMARAARRRLKYAEGERPEWRLFQLAFLLLNLPAIFDPNSPDRQRVELIFFPTGGGKTEAYLGVIAFALVLRRMRGLDESHGGLGVAVLLRYTLRLLTLDQLGRATTLICALEILRREQPELLGQERFAVGLWVGRSATPNRFEHFAEALDEHRRGRREELPVPLERCPWCGEPLQATGVEIRPSVKKAERVVVRCLSAGRCPFANPHPDGLPLVFIDEQIYRELPCFVIATVDKYAMMPWRGETGLLFGRAVAVQDGRFFGPMDRVPRGATKLHDGLLPPEVVVQDELHLITGPLGTMVGLYEIPMQLLAERPGAALPKLIASTATANHAAAQIRALYGPQRQTSVFPPPAVDALETYFSVVNTTDPGRLYIGVAAPGHPIKRILLRVYISLTTAAQKLLSDPCYPEAQKDSLMTLVGYFNSLRELGGMRRLVEDDVRTQAATRGQRVPADHAGPSPWFADREIHEPLELTSRRSTGQISAAKGRLERPHREEETTDIVLASNMISVGVDITRLGLMVVAGQPKTTSEYIQASSRVGRSRDRPGLVVTCYNVNRARDRSHYEHFGAYHESFYRYVEAQSVTPFAPRALERGLTGAFVAATRLGHAALTPARGVEAIHDHREFAERVAERFSERAGDHASTVREWTRSRLDRWDERAGEPDLGYSRFDRVKCHRHLLRLALDEDLDDDAAKFVAPTSMRDVEPTVHLWLAQPGTRRRDGKKGEG